jgi:hypothetical protein
VLTGPAVLCFLCAGYLFGVAEAETSGKHLAGLKANRWAALSEEVRTDSGERRQALTKHHPHLLRISVL